MIDDRSIAELANQYFAERLGSLDFARVELIHDEAFSGPPWTQPRLAHNDVVVHVTAAAIGSGDPTAPMQVLLQYSHELWHSYEFLSWWGINHDWQGIREIVEPFAHAASLCILHDNILGDVPVAQQMDYLRRVLSGEGVDELRMPGVPIAVRWSYQLQEVKRCYDRVMVTFQGGGNV